MDLNSPGTSRLPSLLQPALAPQWSAGVGDLPAQTTTPAFDPTPKQLALLGAVLSDIAHRRVTNYATVCSAARVSPKAWLLWRKDRAFCDWFTGELTRFGCAEWMYHAGMARQFKAAADGNLEAMKFLADERYRLLKLTAPRPSGGQGQPSQPEDRRPRIIINLPRPPKVLARADVEVTSGLFEASE
jgi:hypothetical protein